MFSAKKRRKFGSFSAKRGGNLMILGGLSLSKLQWDFRLLPSRGRSVWWQLMMTQGQQDLSAPRDLGRWEDVLRSSQGESHPPQWVGAGAGLCPCSGVTTHSGAQGASWEDVKVRSRAWRVDLAKGNSFSCVFHMKIQNFPGW